MPAPSIRCERALRKEPGSYDETHADTDLCAGRRRGYGPPRTSAAALVGNIEGTDVPMGPNLPTYAENLENALASNLDFWVDHDAELQERFNAWLAN